jgi:hypothetical protein
MAQPLILQTLALVVVHQSSDSQSVIFQGQVNAISVMEFNSGMER